MKAFAGRENNEGVPALDLPGLDIPAIARGFGCRAQRAESAEAVAHALRAGLQADGPTVLAVDRPLLPAKCSMLRLALPSPVGR